MVYRILNALTGRFAGRCCRSCSEPIAPSDRFGLSEGVCASCRA